MSGFEKYAADLDDLVQAITPNVFQPRHFTARHGEHLKMDYLLFQFP